LWRKKGNGGLTNCKNECMHHQHHRPHPLKNCSPDVRLSLWVNKVCVLPLNFFPPAPSLYLSFLSSPTMPRRSC
jgi:hypothetical protein